MDNDRQGIKPDNDLEEYIYKSGKPEYKVLALACGTGIHLHNQPRYFEKANIQWHGLEEKQCQLREMKMAVSLLKAIIV